jgi:hypothetical protein
MTSPTTGRFFLSAASLQDFSCSWLLWLFAGGSHDGRHTRRVGDGLPSKLQSLKSGAVHFGRPSSGWTLKNGQFLLPHLPVAAKTGGEA